MYYPTEDGELPVVVFAHNGGGKKEDWGEYPQRLAEEGFLTVSLGWMDFAGSADLASAIDAILEKYPDRVDSGSVAFVGGCHGGVKMVSLMNAGTSSYRLKAAVFLSISEVVRLPEDHVPVLCIYSTEDHLGEYYIGVQKRLAEEIIDEPKKVVVFAGTQRGNELVADPSPRTPSERRSPPGSRNT